MINSNNRNKNNLIWNFTIYVSVSAPNCSGIFTNRHADTSKWKSIYYFLLFKPSRLDFNECVILNAWVVNKSRRSLRYIKKMLLKKFAKRFPWYNFYASGLCPLDVAIKQRPAYHAYGFKGFPKKKTYQICTINVVSNGTLLSMYFSLKYWNYVSLKRRLK